MLPMDCECATWGRENALDGDHHPNCPQREDGCGGPREACMRPGCDECATPAPVDFDHTRAQLAGGLRRDEAAELREALRHTEARCDAQVSQLQRDLAEALAIAGSVDPAGELEAMRAELAQARAIAARAETMAWCAIIARDEAEQSREWWADECERVTKAGAKVEAEAAALLVAVEAERAEHAAVAAKLREIVSWWGYCETHGFAGPDADDPCHRCDLDREAWDLLAPEPKPATEAA